jgi:hypothetical protein
MAEFFRTTPAARAAYRRPDGSRGLQPGFSPRTRRQVGLRRGATPQIAPAKKAQRSQRSLRDGLLVRVSRPWTEA